MIDPDLIATFATHEHWMQEALKEARKAAAMSEVPVGAVVVHDGAILGRGHNQVEALHDPTAHAEILAIGAAAATAASQGDSWRLDQCTLYVTLEPCTMCCGAAMLSRIGSVVFGASDPRAGGVISSARLLDGNPYNLRVEVVGGILATECGVLLKDFFREKRS